MADGVERDDELERDGEIAVSSGRERSPGGEPGKSRLAGGVFLGSKALVAYLAACIVLGVLVGVGTAVVAGAIPDHFGGPFRVQTFGWWDLAPPVRRVAFAVVALGLPLLTSLIVAFARARDRRRRALERRPTRPEPSMRPTTAAECPYCKQVVSVKAEAAVRCAACGTAHHAECWREHGGCTTFGCVRGPRERERGAPVVTPHVAVSAAPESEASPDREKRPRSEETRLSS